MHIKITGKIRVIIGGDLHEFRLPEPLYSTYMDLIVSIEVGEIDAYTGDLGREDLHGRLIDWWTEKMPHVEVDIFNKALNQAVEYDIPYYRRNRK